jgi:hypothetical protein
VPGLVLKDPPPKMGSLTGGREGVGSPSVKKVKEGVKISGEVDGVEFGEQKAATVLPEDIVNETPSSLPSRHHRKRPRRCTN